MESIPAFLKHKAPEIEPAWSNVALSNAFAQNAAFHGEIAARTASPSSVLSHPELPKGSADLALG